MKIRHFLMVGAASFAFAASAQAQSICFNGGTSSASCSGTNSFTVDGASAGSGVITTSNIELTNGTAGNYGAVSSSEAFSTGGGISANFDFSITPTTPLTSANYSLGVSNGFAFTISSQPTLNGQSTSQLGVGDANSLEVEFGTFASPAGHAPVSGATTYSNFLAVYDKGNNTFAPSTISTPATINPLAQTAPVGTGTCEGGKKTAVTGSDCFVSGLWNAQISLYHDILTVTLAQDTTGPNGTYNPVFSEQFNVAALLADAGITSGPVYLGFAASSGNQTYDAINIGGFEAVPEPASIAAFGFGLLGLGMIRRRKSAAA